MSDTKQEGEFATPDINYYKRLLKIMKQDLRLFHNDRNARRTLKEYEDRFREIFDAEYNIKRIEQLENVSNKM